MKNLRNLMIIFLLIVSLAGCENSNSSSDFSNNSIDSSEESSTLTYQPSEILSESSNEVKEPEFVDYSNVSLNEKVNIVSKLENYLIENSLLGVPLYDDGKYFKYSDRVVFPTLQNNFINENILYQYIHSYGFGVIEEGNINNDTFSNFNNSNYYHIGLNEKIDSFNYMKEHKGSISKYNKYVFSSYFSKRLSDNKLNYEWFPSLATNDNVINDQFYPLPLDENNNLILNASYQTLSTKYRIYVKTGEDFKYNLNTTNLDLIKYKGRNVLLDDYLTPYKEYYNQSNNFEIHSFLIKGLKDYYDSTFNGFNQEVWNNVGIKTGSDSLGDFLDFEFTFEVNPSYAKNYLNDCCFSPIPNDYIKEIGGINNFASFVYDNQNNIIYYPNDTTLSTGPYVIDLWIKDKEIIFKRNELISDEIKGGKDRFKIEGIHFNIEPNNVNSLNDMYKLYQEGLLDECEIPKEKINNEYLTKGTQLVAGNYSTNLNLNTCDEKTWEYFFGENGTIVQTSKDKYWDIKPIMNNKDFIKGLNLSINRLELGANLGYTPTISGINNNSYIDGFDYLYNSTNNHKQNLLSYYGSQNIVDNYGFDYNQAIESFKKAALSLLDNDIYKKGDIIEIEICWQYENQVSSIGKLIKDYIESAFNDSFVCNNQLTLNINNTYVDNFSDVYYKKMNCGQFDICFGNSTTSNSNILVKLEQHQSNNSNGFNLNWGIDTNSITNLIDYNDKLFTYDALFSALCNGTYVNEKGAKENNN